jgi:hypothetical protein
VQRGNWLEVLESILRSERMESKARECGEGEESGLGEEVFRDGSWTL